MVPVRFASAKVIEIAPKTMIAMAAMLKKPVNNSRKVFISGFYPVVWGVGMRMLIVVVLLGSLSTQIRP